MKNKITRTLIVAGFLTLFTLTCKSQQNCLNLYNLTFNDSIQLKELTVEKITDILGRPSATSSNDLLSDIIGPQVFYHNKGLSFWFNAKGKDSQQRLMSISVYMVRTWDKEFNEFYLPFYGKVIPALDPNMKIDDLLPLFTKEKVKILTAGQRREEMKKALKGIDINLSTTEDILCIEKDGNEINLCCEEVTKFFGRLSINFNVKK